MDSWLVAAHENKPVHWGGPSVSLSVPWAGSSMWWFRSVPSPHLSFFYSYHLSHWCSQHASFRAHCHHLSDCFISGANGHCREWSKQKRVVWGCAWLRLALTEKVTCSTAPEARQAGEPKKIVVTRFSVTLLVKGCCFKVLLGKRAQRTGFMPLGPWKWKLREVRATAPESYGYKVWSCAMNPGLQWVGSQTLRYNTR